MSNPLTKNEWTMLLRVLEHGEVLHPTDAARVAAKIRQTCVKDSGMQPVRDNGQAN